MSRQSPDDLKPLLPESIASDDLGKGYSSNVEPRCRRLWCRTVPLIALGLTVSVLLNVALIVRPMYPGRRLILDQKLYSKWNGPLIPFEFCITGNQLLCRMFWNMKQSCSFIHWISAPTMVHHQTQLIRHGKTSIVVSLSSSLPGTLADNWYQVGVSRIPKSQAALMVNKTMAIPGDEGNYVVMLNIFHLLHCLVSDRSA